MKGAYHLPGLLELMGEAALIASRRRRRAFATLPGAVPAWQVWGSATAPGVDPASPGGVRH